MTVMPEFDPIFVHASARSGSTYVFSVLRRIQSLMCFNEAIMDGKRDYAAFKRIKEPRPSDQKPEKWDLNHHFLDRDDYAEFIDAWDEVMHLCPECPALQDYLPPRGVLQKELVVYLSGLMNYARSRHKRPVLCEITSRGRAGALRGAFGGYHIAQYRDPLNQFGSLMRALIDGGTWLFLSYPATELGVNSSHPLYRLIPEEWRPPSFVWRTQTRAQRWGSEVRYIAVTASASAEQLFRWHMLSWTLNNLAALSYSDMPFDIDKVHDDASYREAIVGTLSSQIGAAPDFSDIRKFDRYYDFDSFSVAQVCEQVASVVSSGLSDGRLDAALRTLGTQPPVTPTTVAAELLLAKIRESLSAMMSSADRRAISSQTWEDLAAKHRRMWHKPGVRWVAERMYPVAAPVVRMARQAGMSI